MRILLFIVAVVLSSLTAAADLSMPAYATDAEAKREFEASIQADTHATPATPGREIAVGAKGPAASDRRAASGFRPWVAPPQTWR